MCAAGDRTLPANGSETPFRGRVRVTADGRAAAFAAAVYGQRVTEVRGELGAAVAMTPDLLGSVHVPVLRRAVEADAGDGSPSPTRERTSLGDVELRVSHLIWQSAPGGAVRRFGALLGAKLPTAPTEYDGRGRYVQTDLQPGCGALVPLAGLSWSVTSSWWSLGTFATLLMPFSVRDGPHPGDSLRAGATFQLQPTSRFAARIGTTGRLDASGDIDGVVDKSSGGLVLYVTPELVVSPMADVVVSVGASFPAVQALRGYRVVSPVAMLGIGVDL